MSFLLLSLLLRVQTKNHKLVRELLDCCGRVLDIVFDEELQLKVILILLITELVVRKCPQLSCFVHNPKERKEQENIHI